MQDTNADLSAESLLGVAKYIIEVLSPSHRLATCNLEEVLSAFKHDFRSKRTRLKCLAVPQEIIASLSAYPVSHDTAIDKEACAVVGLKAGIALRIPVGGVCLGLLSKCLCPVTTTRECGPRCQTARQIPKVYSIRMVSNSKVPPYQILVNEILYHNIKTCLYSSSTALQQSVGIQVKRCDQILDGARLDLKYANKAVVSWIEQPQNADDSIFAACLSGFFQIPRHLHKGDIFRIKPSEHAPEVLFMPGKFSLEDLYFVVRNIEGPTYGSFKNAGESIGFLVLKGETALVQDSNAHSYLPCSTFSSYSKLGALIPKYPEGLKKVNDRLVSAIIPFLKGSSSGLVPAFLLTGPAGCGKRSLVFSAAAQLGMNTWVIDCAEIRSGTPGQSVGKLKAVLSKAKQFSPCIVQMSNIQFLSKDQDGHEDCRVLEEFREQLLNFKTSKFPVILIGTTEASTNLSPAFARTFLLEIPVSALEQEERKLQILQFMAQHGATATEDCLHDIAARCSGFLLGDLAELVALAIRNHLRGKQQLNQSDETVNSKLAFLTFNNYGDAIDKMQSAYAGSIGAPKIPTIKWNDVGGLHDVKREILQTVTLPLKHPGLTAGGLGRSGVLLYGPPGTGKTLLAKAVATECNLNFLSVKGPELLNMYVGQSEANVREIFERAREASPCIIFFDELDALAPNRGRSGDSGGVMDRVVSQLLSELDGLNKSKLLFVIGATNRPDLIDPALLRPGRFDKLLYVGAYEDSESKFSVLSALTRKFKLSPDVNLKIISTRLPSEVTGADMYAVCSGAWLGAVRRVIKENNQDSKNYPREVEVTQEDFYKAVSSMIPSVSVEDMQYFKGLQQQMSAVPTN